jgi:hypothetical protein
MSSSQHVDAFLATYPEPVQETAFAARDLVRSMLPDIVESVDESARLVSYSYGSGYKGVICTLIMSQKGVKLGIFRGSELPDPKELMTGTGKVHRHVQLQSPSDVRRAGLRQLLKDALRAWRERSRASG